MACSDSPPYQYRTRRFRRLRSCYAPVGVVQRVRRWLVSATGGARALPARLLGYPRVLGVDRTLVRGDYWGHCARSAAITPAQERRGDHRIPQLHTDDLLFRSSDLDELAELSLRRVRGWRVLVGTTASDHYTAP